MKNDKKIKEDGTTKLASQKEPVTQRFPIPLRHRLWLIALPLSILVILLLLSVLWLVSFKNTPEKQNIQSLLERAEGIELKGSPPHEEERTAQKSLQPDQKYNKLEREQEHVHQIQKLWVTFLLLKHDIAAGIPFQSSLALFEKQLDKNSSMQSPTKTLQKLASERVWAASSLIDHFPKNLFLPGEETQGNGSSRIFDFMKRFLQVRHTNSAVSAHGAKLREALQLLEQGHIAKAFQVIQQLPTPTAEKAQEWLKAVYRYLMVQKQLNVIERTLLKSLSPP